LLVDGDSSAFDFFRHRATSAAYADALILPAFRAVLARYSVATAIDFPKILTRLLRPSAGLLTVAARCVAR